MARGWESKSVEDQIAEKESQTSSSAKKYTPEEAARREKREGLLLARARTMASLESTRDVRYRALLERTLAHLDGELATLG